MTAAPEIPSDVMAAAREALAVEYERAEYGGGPYPTYADLAREGSGSFTPCSIHAIARAILAERHRCVEAVKAERLFQDGESSADADPTDISYDLAICHAADAIKRFSH